MTIKTYSRARTAEANARAFCEKAEIIAAEIIRHETETGFTCIIVADLAHASMIETAGWMFRATETPELPQGLLDQPAEEAPAAQEEVPTDKPKASSYIAEKSWLEKPTKKVWDICDRMKGQPRKEVIEACRKAGIAYGTARTQYQAWKTAHGY